jgi:hypothetical protein
MFTHPYIGSQIARERQRDMLAQADQQRWYASFASSPGGSRRADGTERRPHRALRTALPLRPQART